LLPDALSLPLREVAAAASPEQGAAATGPDIDDEEWWLESEPVLDPGRPNWYQQR